MNYETSSMRILIYCHDIFGLGHLSRSLAIAHGLTDHYPQASVLILTGSPVAGNFRFGDRVDFIRIPGVVRPIGKEFEPRKLQIGIKEVFAIRSALIEQTADKFDPHLFLVDTKPTGLDDEILPALELLRKKGCKLVLGLRDIMDGVQALSSEWNALGVIPLLENVYDQIWVYGLKEYHDTLQGLDLPDHIMDKVVYTGYFRRQLPLEGETGEPATHLPGAPCIIASPGGGGDGDGLIDWVIKAYEFDPDLQVNALLVFGPFMPEEMRRKFHSRVINLDRVKAITFDSGFANLLADAIGVVSMGGYNSFCEIMSFGKNAIIVPRRAPKLEQQIRAQRAEELGLVRMLIDDEKRDPAMMADAIRILANLKPPSELPLEGMLDGLDTMTGLVGRILNLRLNDNPVGAN